MSKKIELKNKRAEGIYDNLDSQLKKIAKHNRQGSFKTRERYLSATRAFCKHVANEFGTQKFANIQDKHIDSYIKDMQDRGLAPGTIKTNLGAIRFFHNKCDNAKHELSPNEAYELEKRTFGGIERAWDEREYQGLKRHCLEKVQEMKYGWESYDKTRDCATLARTMGLRIHEVTEISRSDAEAALRENRLYTDGKGGKPRYVPLSEEGREVLEDRMADVERGRKLFVDEGQKTHKVINNIQKRLGETREYWQLERNEEEPNRTMHGLRHCYAREQYEQALDRGLSDKQAKVHVSRLLGHERGDVTLIYLAKLTPEDVGHGE